VLSELLLFLSALLSGAVLRVLYFFASALAKSTRLTVMRYIFDVLWCVTAFCAFAAFTVYLCGGVFLPYVLLGFLAGLTLGSLVFQKRITHVSRDPTPRHKSE